MQPGVIWVQSFKTVVDDGIAFHSGDPTCNAAHAALLAMLNTLGTAFLDASATISKSQKGNLGEFISYQLAMSHYPTPAHVRFSGNALNPLSRISGAGVDLVYLYLDQTNPANDLLYIQEVKTTGATNLDYFDALKADYSKLFAGDPQLTLKSRVQYIQNILEYERGDPVASARVAALASVDAATSTRVRLLPTGISTAGVGDPKAKLTAIRSSIAAFGWAQANIRPWSIVMYNLEARLTRLARGQP